MPAWASIVPLRTFFILANWKTTQIRAWKSHLLFVLKNGSTWASLRHFTVSSVPSQSSFLIVQQKLKIVSIYRAFFLLWIRAITIGNFGGFPWKAMRCVVCGREHKLYKCEVFRSFSRQLRENIVRSHNLCRVCLNLLGYNHSCNPITCQHCHSDDQFHHYLLCKVRCNR